MSASAHAVLPYVTACQEDFVGDPATISIPVLVIHGDQDRVLPYEASGSRLPALLRDDQPPRARAPITIDLDTTDVEVMTVRSTAGPARCTAPGPRSPSPRRLTLCATGSPPAGPSCGPGSLPLSSACASTRSAR
jgi:hypothetical protein